MTFHVLHDQHEPFCISAGKRTRPFVRSSNLAQYGGTPRVLYVQLHTFL